MTGPAPALAVEFVTETGSVYQLDETGHRARRLSGTQAPTARVGSDGAWRAYVTATPVVVGQPVVVVWAIDDEPDGTGLLTARSTVTSPVVSVGPAAVRP